MPAKCATSTRTPAGETQRGLFREETPAIPRLKALPVRANAIKPLIEDKGEARRSVNWLHTARWQRLRLSILARDGYMCQGCAKPHLLAGRYPSPTSAVVDHKTPHRGDPDLFWDDDNLHAVCKGWHDVVKQAQEKRGEAD